MSIAGRLFLSYLAVVAVGLLAAGVTISGLLFRYENDVTRVRLAELAVPFQTAIQNGVRDGKQPRQILDELEDQARAADARLLILSPNTANPNLARRVLVDSQGTLMNTKFAQPDQGNIGQFVDAGEPWIFVQQQLQRAVLGAGGQGTIVVARPRAAYGDSVRALLPSLVVSGLAAIGLALIVAALLARTITKPLRDLAAGAKRFASGDYRARVGAAGPSEVARLGAAFDDMAAEIERARASEHGFLADISHELRTPLTSIHGFAQAIVDREARGEGVTRAAEIIQRESRRLVRLVEGLLQVARIESGASELRHEPVDPRAIVQDAVDALAVQAASGHVRFDVALAPVSSLRGDPDRLAQLFINLLDNAVKHSPSGGRVEVRGAVDDGSFVVRIRDAGSGVPAGAETRVFDRFYRGENSTRDGSGLGLAIARAIAHAHGGDISARNADGGGAEFAVRLPASGGTGH
ncbi:MAG: HAMP domain-containing histidine kinase [Chloroflexota bacterium]|nr:HAMP domain-containing histidine kinase [Chloroflexota bacterium]